MTVTTHRLSGYERRVKVAVDALMLEQPTLGAEKATLYATCVLRAVDHIPETVR
jgi:hypothetical protein